MFKEGKDMNKNRKNLTVDLINENSEKTQVNIYVIRPTNNSIQSADRYRAKIWNQCVLDGVLTKKELSNFLKERNIWTEEKESSEREIINELKNLEQELYLGLGHDGKRLKISEGQRIAIEMRLLRLKLRDLIADKISFEENTAEALADNAKFDYFVADCTYYENGEKVYKDVEDYNSKSSDEIAFAAANALAQMMYQLDSRFEENLPENKWLKKFNLVNDDLSLINKNGDLVDIEGRRINENGNYINEENQLIDRNGNLINEDGTYVLQANYYEPDELSEKIEEKIKSRRKVKG